MTFGYAAGGVYLLVGVLGFFLTGFEHFVATDGARLVIFEINPLHNLVHVLLAVALLAGASAGEVTARQITALVGLVFLAVGVLGFFAEGTQANILALNLADHILHLVTAVVAVVTAGASRTAAESPAVR